MRVYRPSPYDITEFKNSIEKLIILRYDYHLFIFGDIPPSVWPTTSKIQMNFMVKVTRRSKPRAIQ